MAEDSRRAVARPGARAGEAVRRAAWSGREPRLNLEVFGLKMSKQALGKKFGNFEVCRGSGGCTEHHDMELFAEILRAGMDFKYPTNWAASRQADIPLIHVALAWRQRGVVCGTCR